MGPANPLQRAIDGAHAVARRLVGRRAHPRLVELHHIDAGRLQIAQFLVHRGGVVHRHLFFVFVELVSGLLRQGERTGQRDLRRTIGLAQQELDIAQFDRSAAADFADHTRHRRHAPRLRSHLAGMLGIDPFQREREPVGIAFAPDLPVGDDVDPRALHLADRQYGPIVLRLFEQRLGDTPDLVRMSARHAVLLQRRAIHQPIGLRIASNNCRRQQVRRIAHPGSSSRRMRGTLTTSAPSDERGNGLGSVRVPSHDVCARLPRAAVVRLRAADRPQSRMAPPSGSRRQSNRPRNCGPSCIGCRRAVTCTIT